jgi:LmbE family N-acetylglucosaminyl deacetylase
MATLVCFHAHPDDEAITTSGVMAQWADAGGRVVLVLATRGELGEPVTGVLAPDEQLWQRRVTETRESARLLGAGRVEFLGYRDSGMMGERTNDDPGCFWQADVEEAAGRLAALLEEEAADLLTIYDDHGNYGHPDHIQVYRVGRRAAELAGMSPDRVLCATFSREHLVQMHDERLLEEAETAGAAEAVPGPVDGAATSSDGEPGAPEAAAATGETAGAEIDLETFGLPEADITHAIDVRSVIERKRQSMRAHRSQIAEDAFFLSLPREAFERAFGTEWFASLSGRRPGEPMRSTLEVR